MIEYKCKPQLRPKDLAELFRTAWETEGNMDYQKVLSRSLSYICAYADHKLIGFVNLAWDGGIHAFILDTTVHPNFQKQGIGTELVKRAIREAQAANCEWVHVDYEAHLDGFYKACGFSSSYAGALRLE